MKDYGNAIRTLRKRNGMTQNVLAEKLNISGQAVSKWENNSSQPDLETVVKMTEIFGVTMNEFTELCLNNDADIGQENLGSESTTQPTGSETENEAQATQPRLFGVCFDCGTSIYIEDDIGQSSPKLKCKQCVEKEIAEKKADEQAQKQKSENAKRAARSKITTSFIVTAIIVVALAAVMIFILPSSWLRISVTAILLYITALQIIWDTSPVSDIFTFFLGGPKLAFGFIIELSIDGIIWYLTVKLALWILGIILSILSFILGTAISVAIGIFSFPFALYKAIAEPEEIEFLL